MNFQEFFTVNPWWGKLLGAVFGYLTAGAAGAFFGLLVGNFFDRGLAAHFSNPHLLYFMEKRTEVKKIFFESTFLIMGYIAKSDGRVSQQEIQMAELQMIEMRLDEEQKSVAKQLFNEGKRSQFKPSSVLDQLQTACDDKLELLKLFVDIQYRVAQVDGLTTKKIKALDTVFSYLGFAPLHQQYRFYEDFNDTFSSQSDYTQKEQPHSSSQQQDQKYTPHYPPNTLAHAYSLIEVSPDATRQEVKRAYRRLLSKNHPDKLMAQGLSEEMIKIANDKTHKIRKAYELICDSKGW